VYGKLNVNVVPVDPSGSEDLPDEMIPDEPEDLIDTRIDYVIQIDQAVDLPKNFCRDTFVEYQLYLNEEKFRTNVVAGSNRNPIYNYSRQHTQEWVTDGFIKYLKEDYLIFKVFGFAEIKKREQPGEKQPIKKLGMSANNVSGSQDQSTIDTTK
jgi:hypothetical protein